MSDVLLDLANTTEDLSTKARAVSTIVRAMRAEYHHDDQVEKIHEATMVMLKALLTHSEAIEAVLGEYSFRRVKECLQNGH